MQKNPIHSAPVRAYNVVAPDGKVVSSWDYREDAAEDLRDNKAAYPAGCRILTDRGLRRFKAHLAGDLGALNRNPRYTVDTTQRGVIEVDGRLLFLDEVFEDQMALSVMAAVGDASAKKTLRTLLSAKKAQKRAESIAWMQDAYNVSPQQVVAGSGDKSFAKQVLDGWAAFGREPSGASQEVRRAAVTAVAMADASPMLSVSGGAEQKRGAVSAAATIAQAMGLLSDRDQVVLLSHAGRLIRNPSGAKQRARGTRTVSPQKHHTRSWQQDHERYMQSAAASRRTAAAQPEFDHHGERPRDSHIDQADEHRFAAKQIREQSRPYAFQLRSESGNSASFQSHAEALKWAESNLKKGEFFTISKDSDHFHEHYVKE